MLSEAMRANRALARASSSSEARKALAARAISEVGEAFAAGSEAPAAEPASSARTQMQRRTTIDGDSKE